MPCRAVYWIIEAQPKGAEMNKNMIIAAVLAASVAGIGPASAQDHHDNGRHDNGRRDAPGQMKKEDRNDHRYDHADERRNDRADYNHNDDRGPNRGAGPRHDLRKGGRLPSEYRGHQYVVDDWRGHHLNAPPRGYHWVQTGGDYVLVAIATGVIASLLLSN
jgi:Ni/Co efflux regulator RcnB